MKTCNKCKTEQPLTEYNMDNSQADSLTTQCKSCFQSYRDKVRAARQAQADVVKAIAAEDAELEAKYERINYEARKFLLGY